MEENRMNVRLLSIKALSILLLLSVSASSYSMQQLKNALGKVYPPIVAVAGLGTLAYQIYKVKYSEPSIEQASGKLIVALPTITEMPIAQAAYLMPVANEAPLTENMVVMVNAIGKAEGMPNVQGSQKQVVWADEQGLALTSVRRFKNSKSALAKYESANAFKIHARASNAAAEHKGSLAQSKRTPSRKIRAKTQAPVVAVRKDQDLVISTAQTQIAQFNRLAREAQAARAAQQERKQKAEADKKIKNGRIS